MGYRCIEGRGKVNVIDQSDLDLLKALNKTHLTETEIKHTLVRM